MLKIDIHTHVVPENWPNLQERYGYGGWVQIEHTGPGCARMVQEGGFTVPEVAQPDPLATVQRQA